MDGDVECRFAVFLQLHCAVKVEFERGIFNRIHDVARLGQRAKSADFERSPALGIARSIVTHGEVCGGGGVRQRLFIIVFRLPAKRNRSTMNPNSRAT